MGRSSSGKITTSGSERLELSFLIHSGYIRKGFQSGIINWNNGSSSRIESVFTEEGKYIRLIYQIKKESGEIIPKNYQIRLESIPSNLGKGEVYYFICPISGKRSRILYRCYGSQIFKSRNAYRNRIYYPSQIVSKNYYHSERKFSLESQISKLQSQIRKSHYQGNETRLMQRIRKLSDQKQQHEQEDWMKLLKSFMKYF